VIKLTTSYIESLRVRATRFKIVEAIVLNCWVHEDKPFFSDNGKTWEGEEQETLTIRVLMPIELYGHEMTGALCRAAEFLGPARNRARLKLRQEVLDLKARGLDDSFHAAVVLRGMANPDAYLPSEWAELLTWNALPDPEEAARRIVEDLLNGTFDEESTIELLRQSVLKVDTSEALHTKLCHPHRYQEGYNSTNHRTKRRRKRRNLKADDEDK
jgi:hypothetical protein